MLQKVVRFSLVTSPDSAWFHYIEWPITDLLSHVEYQTWKYVKNKLLTCWSPLIIHWVFDNCKFWQCKTLIHIANWVTCIFSLHHFIVKYFKGLSNGANRFRENMLHICSKRNTDKHTNTCTCTSSLFIFMHRDIFLTAPSIYP